MIVFGKQKNGWVRTDGSLVDIDQMRVHVLDILEGSYSMHNIPDTAFIEQKVITHKVFKRHTYKGTPDIRIIAFNQVPVMAMLRVPTEESDGKANLHAGALAIGIEIASGITTHAIYRNHVITRLPSNSKIKLHGLKIPHWDEMLKITSEIQELTKIGYLGIDFVLDKNEGPMILELNARPGLAIQNANIAPLKKRLERVADLKIKNAEKAVRVAKELFGGEIEREVEEVAGRPVIGFIEKACLIGRKGKKELRVKIDTGAYSSSIDEELAIELGYKEALEKLAEENPPSNLPKKEALKLSGELTEKLAKHKDIFEVVSIRNSLGQHMRIKIPMMIELRGKKIKSNITVTGRGDLRYPVIIGRRDLREFLVDSGKRIIEK
jgi:alpha-L-glutamate ligase-like protein